MLAGSALTEGLANLAPTEIREGNATSNRRGLAQRLYFSIVFHVYFEVTPATSEVTPGRALATSEVTLVT